MTETLSSGRAYNPATATCATRSRQRWLGAAVLVYCAGTLLIFAETLISMVTIWMRSQTFAHGFLILPISLWLLWRQRAQFSRVSAHPQPRAAALVVGGGLVWHVAGLVDVQLIQQLALVAMLISGVWTIIGTELTRRAAFPLAFLFLAVPMGTGLIPPLMEITAHTTEFMVRATGIPVYREGMYLALPSGNWSVIEECSGVRYLIASVTLGLLFAYLTYTSFWRRLLFVLLAVVIPIGANSLRAYGVVMLGHMSDMQLATGNDHLIYGWVFFGLVMALFFWIGGFWQQKPAPHAAPPGPATLARPASAMLWALLTLAGAGLWPALAQVVNGSPAGVNFDPLQAPAAAPSWQAVQLPDWRWEPVPGGADRQLNQLYRATQPVGLFLRQYLQPTPGTELVNTDTDLWRPDRTVWKVLHRQNHTITLDRTMAVDEVTVMSPQQKLLVWSWYRVDGRNTANPYSAKLLEARQQIVTGQRYGTRLFIATPIGTDAAAARTTLQAFISAHRTAIDATLAAGIRDGIRE